MQNPTRYIRNHTYTNKKGQLNGLIVKLERKSEESSNKISIRSEVQRAQRDSLGEVKG